MQIQLAGIYWVCTQINYLRLCLFQKILAVNLFPSPLLWRLLLGSGAGLHFTDGARYWPLCTVYMKLASRVKMSLLLFKLLYIICVILCRQLKTARTLAFVLDTLVICAPVYSALCVLLGD